MASHMNLYTILMTKSKKKTKFFDRVSRFGHFCFSKNHHFPYCQKHPIFFDNNVGFFVRINFSMSKND